MHWFTRVALKKTWITYLLTAILAGGCLWSTLTLKQELFPDIELPMTTIVTIYPQAQPETVMNEVTIPIEKAIGDIPHLKHITSTSKMNTSIILAEFEYGTNMADVNASIKNNISKISLPVSVLNLPATMPDISANPMIIPINMNSQAIVTLSVTGDVSVEQLNQVAGKVAPELKTVNGVFDVGISGGNVDKIIVNPSVEKLGNIGMSVSQLAGVLAMHQYGSLDEIQNTKLSPVGPAIKDIADVTIGPEPTASINRTNGKPSVSLAITKTQEANTVKTADGIVKKVQELQKDMPSGVSLLVVTNQATYIENSINSLSMDAIIGGLLAILVVFIFLMAIKASLVTGISIPMSVLIGFLIMRFTNLTVNILTLSAMTMAIGRVIDDSIVMVEVTYRRMQAGEKFPQATLNGSKEIVNAITSATITTVVIFVPLALVGGIIGEMFIPFALTITFTMIGSLLTALTIVPALTKILDKGKKTVVIQVSWYQRTYSRMLKWCLANRRVSLIVAIVLFLVSVGLLPVIGTNFLPEMNTGIINVKITMPEGTPTSALLNAVTDIEAVLAESEEVNTYSSTIGNSVASSFSSLFSGSGGASSASITITTPKGVKTTLALQHLTEAIAKVPTIAEVTVNSVSAMSAGSSSIDLAVRGNTLEDITTAANKLAIDISQIDGVGKVVVSVGKEELQVVITPDMQKLAAAGLLAQASELQGEFMLLENGGTVASTTVGGKTYDIYIQSVSPQLDSAAAVENIRIGISNPVKLTDIATIATLSLPTELSRTDQKLAATVSATITTKNVGAVNSDVAKIVKSVSLPPGVVISSGGIFEDMKESFSKMYISILVAIVLSYIVLVFTFRSFKKSFILMASLPLAAVGAFAALLITGHSLGVIGLMGILMLVGIVLTNAVVLLAYIEQLEKQGLTVTEAIIKSGETRLRPILMTALTTLIAMLPMALGFGEGLIVASELAIVVIGGLFTSTMLTLLVVPVIYAIVYDKPPKKVE